MNGVTVLVGDSSLMQQVRALPFVKWVQYSGQLNIPKAARKKAKSKATEFNYGATATQINQLNGSHLHTRGFMGQNIHIGVLDAGFANVDVNSDLTVYVRKVDYWEQKTLFSRGIMYLPRIIMVLRFYR